MIALVHAYSRHNAGDGLLIDLTLEHLRRVGVPREDCELFALDASSFHDFPSVHQVGVAGRKPSPQMVVAAGQLAAAAASVATGGRVDLGQVSRRLREADAIVGVAGGYLRAGDATSSLGTLLNHVPQLGLAARSRVPTVYMPQSIGPLRGPVGALVRRLLGTIDLVCVRDEVSQRELAGGGRLARYPDLVALHLAEQLEGLELSEGGRSGPVILVGRTLNAGGDYVRRLVALAERLSPVIWAVQAEGGGGKSDRLFYRRVGVTDDGSRTDVVGRHPDAVVVSVRLHGALQSLLEGVPAVHLSYQRKGWSAYADLGLEEFVHDARRFDPHEVARQVEGLRRAPEVFWERVVERRPGLLERSDELTTEIGRVLLGR